VPGVIASHATPVLERRFRYRDGAPTGPLAGCVASARPSTAAVGRGGGAPKGRLWGRRAPRSGPRLALSPWSDKRPPAPRGTLWRLAEQSCRGGAPPTPGTARTHERPGWRQGNGPAGQPTADAFARL